MSPDSDDRRPHPVRFDGEHWRTPRVSVIGSISIATGAAAVLVWMSGLVVAGVAAIAGISAGGVVLLVTAKRRRILKRVCGVPLLFLTGPLLFGCMALAFQSVRGDILAARTPATVLRQPQIVGTLLLTAGIAIAAGGASVTGRNSIRPSDLTSTVGFGILAIALPLFALIGGAAATVAGFAVDPGGTRTVAGEVLFGGLGNGGIRYADLTVAWTLTLVSITFVVLGVKYLPIATLAPPSRRERLTAQVNRARSVLHTLRVVVFAAPLVVLAVETVRTDTPIEVTDEYLRLLSAIGSAGPLRWVLLGGIGFGIAGIALGGMTKRAAGLSLRRTVLRAIPLFGGGVLLAAALQFGSGIVTVALAGPIAEYRFVVDPVLVEYRPATLVLAVLVAGGTATIGLYVVATLVEYLLLPEYADGAALLSVGLFISSVGGLLVGLHPLVGFVGIAGSFVVWDVNTHAISLRRELGRRTPTRRAELVHLGGSLLTAALGITVGVAGLLLTGMIPSPPERIAPVTAVVSVVGLLALVFSLRSR